MKGVVLWPESPTGIPLRGPPTPMKSPGIAPGTWGLIQAQNPVSTAGPPNSAAHMQTRVQGFGLQIVLRDILFLVRFGGDLLSHVLRRSTIGVRALNGRVRDGIGCLALAMTTKPEQKQALRSLLRSQRDEHQSIAAFGGLWIVPCRLVLSDCLSGAVLRLQSGCYRIKSSLSSN